MLWVEEPPPAAAVRFLWSLLLPEQRDTFAFCTFALQLRSAEGRLFDFLGLPPAARGSFLERANSEAWWDLGRLLHPHLSGLLQQPWVQDIAQQGAPAIHERLHRWCRNHQLDFPEHQVAIFWRLLELEAAAAQRLAAARSWADLFERLWPTVDPLHPCATRALQQLMARLPEAPFEQRPLFELTDFLKRPLTRRRLEVDENFALQVEALRAQELTLRFQHAPGATLEGLPELLEASGPHWQKESSQLLQAIVASAPDAALRLSPLLLLTAARTDQLPLARAALAPLAPGERIRAFEASMALPGSAALLEALIDLASTVAAHEGDVELLFTSQSRRDAVLALLSITKLLADRRERNPEHLLAPLLARTEASSRLDWALREPDTALARLAAQTGAQAARELNLSVEEVVSRCASATLPNGPRVLLAFAEGLPSKESLTPALHASPRFAEALLIQVLNEPWNASIEPLARLAYEVMPPEVLLSRDVLQALRRAHDRSRTRELVRRIGPLWMRAVCTEELATRELGDWIDIPSLRQWLRDVSNRQLFSATPPESEDFCLARLSHVLLSWFQAGRDSHDKEWVSPFLDALVRGASARQMDEAAEPLASVLRSLRSSADVLHLAAQTIATVTRTHARSGWRLVEVVFPPLYASMHREEPSLVRILASAITGRDWDKAKPLRHWLIDTYVSRGWPPGSLLRCLDADTALFQRLVHRASRTQDGLSFLRGLPSAVESDPALAKWRRAVADALKDPWRPVDYE